MKRRAAPWQPPENLDQKGPETALEKGLKLCIYGSPGIHILLWNEGLPPRNHQKLYISVNLDQKGPEIMRI